MKLCMFHPADMPMERGWVGRIEGDEVVHLASQTLQHLFTGGGSARDHARYPPVRRRARRRRSPSPPSVRVFDDAGSFEFANPAALVGPGTQVSPPRAPLALAVDVGLAGLVGLEAVVAVSPVARVRAPQLPPPKDRDFAVVLGPWFTTMDEAAPAPAVTVDVGDAPRPAATKRFDWEAARAFAGGTRCSGSAIFCSSSPAAVVEMPAGRGRHDRGRGPGHPHLRDERPGRRGASVNHTFRRLDGLPPYVFATIRELTLELRRAGEDVVDLGFGNPDLPSPDGRRREAPGGGRQAAQPPLLRVQGHPQAPRGAAPTSTRADSASSSTPRPRSSRRWARRRGSSHLMWTLVEPGDAALVPAPSYPIHIHAPILAGASVFQVAMAPDQDLFANLADAYARASPRPRVLLLSFPHNPTTATVELEFMERVVEFAREREILVVHDFAYADLAFDGHEPPSILQVPGRDATSRWSSTR